jgi:hypothetical protein
MFVKEILQRYAPFRKGVILKIFDLQIHGVSEEIYFGIGEFFVFLHKPDDLVIVFKDLPMFQIFGDGRSKKDFHSAQDHDTFSTSHFW